MVDFFISYTSTDREWAEWIAFTLEEAEFTTTLQAWDFRPGSNFVLEMQRAASDASRTLMVLSPDYLNSQYAAPEWAAAFTQDPQGQKRTLVPVHIRECDPRGLLASVVRIDLVGLDEVAARSALIEGLDSRRAKPKIRPAFPGVAASASTPVFPGKIAPGNVRNPTPYIPKVKRAITDVERRRFIRDSFSTVRDHFRVGLQALESRAEAVDTDFQETTAADFTAEAFVHGKSTCRSRIWQGGSFSSDGISVAEGSGHYGGNSCNEILSIAEEGGELHLTSLMGVGFGSLKLPFDLKKMTPEQAAEYLWRRFVAPLEG